MTGALHELGLRLTWRAQVAAFHSPANVRLLMAASLPRLARRTGRGSGALARALRSMALGRVPAEEREWAARIEARRQALFAQDGVVRPFEAGLPATVSAATSGVSIPPVWGPFLMRLVRELSPELCLELGTGVGISTAYQAAALDLNGAGRLITIDGSPEWAALAEQGLSALGLGRVQGEVGPIASTLPGALEDQPPVDYALVDAEHTEEATVGYFHSLLPYLSDGAVVVFDDIPWTSGMRRAWRAIARHPRVSGFALGRMGVAVMSTASG